MTPGVGSYLAGSLALAVIVLSLGFGALRLRRMMVPALFGAPARLAEVVLATAMLVLVLQALGSVGLLRAGWIVAGCVVAGIGAATLAAKRAPAPGPARRPAAPAVSRGALLLAAGVAAWTIAEWGSLAQLSLDRGMFSGDTAWYHMPTAARFAQEGSIAGLHFTDPLGLAVWFYPHTHELLNGAWIVLFGSDFLAPLMNLGWLGVALLAAWCIGRPYGAGPATLVAAALVFDSGLLWETQAGEARNDVMALAMLLALAALLANGRLPHGTAAGGGPLRFDRGVLVLAGLAGGVAISVKLTMIAPVAAIAVGIVALSGRGRRGGTLASLGLPLLLTGGYWYARNLVESGNPLPLIERIGPIELPHPEQMAIYPRPPHSVAGYLFDGDVWWNWFLPELDDAFGPLWPLLLAGALAGIAYALLRARRSDRLLGLLAGAALLTAILYLLTPISASGPEGEPRGFFTNLRYLSPALLLGLVLAPLAPPLRATSLRRGRVLAALGALFAATTLATLGWPGVYPLGTAVLVAALVGLPLAAAEMVRRGVRAPAIAAPFAALAALALPMGHAQEAEYTQQRYADPEPFFKEVGPVEPFRWARDVSGARIGIVGSGQVYFTQYGLYGTDLSNHVQYVGVEAGGGSYRLAADCRELRTAINAGDYDYLVTSQFGTIGETSRDFPVRRWLRGDPALEELVAEDVEPQPDWVYRVEGGLDPDGCDAGTSLASARGTPGD